MLRVLVFLVALCTLSGCDRMSAAFTSAPVRINQAFPIPDEVALSMTRLLASMAGDERATKAAKDQYERLMNVRALTCTASSPVGRFDAPADIRKKFTDAACFDDQDAQLADWIGLRRVSVLMDKAALYPLADLPARQTLPATREATVGVVASANSNVAVLISDRGSFTSVRLPDGKAIKEFRIADNTRSGLELSPNGRIFAVPLGSNRGLKFIDIETGDTLWSTDKYRRLIAWLPALKALVLVQSSQGQAPTMIDTLNGKAILYPAPDRHPSWAAPVPEGGNRHLIGGSNNAALMDHSRDADGTLSATQLGFWRLAKPVTSSTPFLMSKGRKIVYVTTRSLAWLDLSTGDQGYWDTSAFNGYGYAKLDDTSILFASSVPGTMGSQGRVIDIEQTTVSPVSKNQRNDGMILALTPRSGYLRTGNVVEVGGSMESESGEDLQRAIASAQLEVQLAKLKAETAERAPSIAPMLSQVPANAQVAVIGVYESKSGAHGSGVARTAGSVRVSVLPAATPLVLVLSSYEPVRWIVQNSGRKISAVLLSGYHESSAFGIDGAPVLKIGSTYAYKMDSPEYARLKTDIGRYVSNPVRTFQGGYSGQDFSVSGF